MIDSPLATYSNLAIIVAIVVFMMAFIAFTVDFVKGSAMRSDARLERRIQQRAHHSAQSRELVGVGAGSAAIPLTHPHSEAPSEGAEEQADAAPESGALTPLRFARILSAVGTLVLATGVILRGLATERVPWGNMYEFSMTGAAVVMAMYLVLSTRLRDLRVLGVFIVGPMLILMLIAQTQWFLPAAELTPSLQNSHWLVIHVVVAIVSIALFSLGAVTSTLQLIQGSVEKREVSSPATRIMSRVPSSTRLENLSFQITAVGFVLWTFTLISGSIWANYAWGRYWGWDPKEVWTFVIWVVYAAYLHARATQGFRGNRAAYFALAGFAAIIVNYTFVNTVINGLHSYSGL